MTVKATLLVALLAVIVSSAYSQRCASINRGGGMLPTGKPNFPSVCSGVVNYNVFLPPNVTQDAIEAQVSGSYPLLWSLVTTDKCRALVANFLCGTTFVRADNCPSNPTPVPICRSVCSAISMACDSLTVGVLGKLGINLDCSRFPASGTCNAMSTPTWIPKARCETYTGTACAGLVSGPVFIPGYADQSQLEAFVGGSAWAFNVAPRAAGCAAALPKYLCGQVFMPCREFPLDMDPDHFYWPKIPAPIFPCRHLCLEANSKCLALNTPDKVQFIANSPVCYSSSFPEKFYNLSSSLPTLTCNNYTDPATGMSLTSYRIPGNCPKPLIRPSRLDSSVETLADGQCVLPCPLPLYTEDEFRGADIFYWIMSVAGLVLSSHMFLTWIVFAKKRKQFYIVIFNGLVWAVAVMDTISAGVGINKGPHLAYGPCKNDFEYYATKDTSWCTFSAWLASYLVISASSWWLVQAFDLWFKVVAGYQFRPGSREFKIKEIIYHGYAWGIAAFFSFLSLGLEICGSGELSVAWCAPNGLNPKHPNTHWAVFYFPVLIIAFLGFLFMFWTIAEMVRSVMRLNQPRARFWWLQYARSVVFTGGFLAVWSFIFAFRAYAWFNEKLWKDSMVEYVTCLLKDQYQPGFTGSCGQKPKASPNVLAWMLIHLAVSGEGVFNFFIYGVQKENVTLWTKSCRRKLAELRGSTASEMTTNHSTNILNQSFAAAQSKSGKKKKSGTRSGSRAGSRSGSRSDGAESAEGGSVIKTSKRASTSNSFERSKNAPGASKRGSTSFEREPVAKKPAASESFETADKKADAPVVAETEMVTVSVQPDAAAATAPAPVVADASAPATATATDVVVAAAVPTTDDVAAPAPAPAAAEPAATA